MGKRVAEKFNFKLPFLLKILSINQALSIQAHPDKRLAEELNKRDPENYPDDNHKPEIAIAIDQLEAIVGLKEMKEIQSLILEYPEFIEILDAELNDRITEYESHDIEKLAKDFFASLMSADDKKIKIIIDKIIKRIKSKESKTRIEKRFLTEFNNYGYDIGLLSLLSFNHIILQTGEAIFTPAGIPHAYLEGNIIECMANSDNVVRAGLTPKYKDVPTLIEMLEVNNAECKVDLNENNDVIKYRTSAEEFEINKFKSPSSIRYLNNSEIMIILVLHGEIKIKYFDREMTFGSGSVCMIPAFLNKLEIEILNETQAFCVSVP